MQSLHAGILLRILHSALIKPQVCKPCSHVSLAGNIGFPAMKCCAIPYQYGTIIVQSVMACEIYRSESLSVCTTAKPAIDRELEPI